MSDVDALLDLYSQVDPAAPRDSAEPRSNEELKNFYDTEMASPKGQALPKAVGTVADDPEKAGTVLKISKQSGIPPTVVAADPEGAKNDLKAAEARQYVGDNPHIQDYVNSHPLPSVSNDDYKSLNDISEFVGPAFGTFPNDPVLALKTLKATPPFSWAVSIYDLAKTLGDAFASGDPEAIKQVESQGLPLFAAMLVAGGRTLPKARGPLSSSAEINEFLKSAGHGPVESPGMQTRAEIDEFLRKKAEEEGAPKLLEKPKGPPEELTPAAEAMVKAGKMPPARVDPVVDKFHVAQAGRDLEAFDETFNLVNQSKTKERSPEAMEAFLTKVLGQKTLSIPVDVVDKLYGTTVPAEGDELLGYEPGMKEKLALAKESGTDVQIPMARFLAHTDEATYSALKNDLRLREEGVTKEEGKELGEVEEPKLKEGEEAPPPPTIEQAVKKSFYFQPLFQNAKAMGVTEGEFAKYFNKIQKADEADYQKVLDKEKRSASKRLTPEWEANEAEMRAEVETDLRSRPDILADRFLRTGELPSGQKVEKVKLLRSAVERYAKSGMATRNILDKYTSPTGDHPDAVASFLDFPNGASLIKALSDLDKARGKTGPKFHFNKLVEEETAKRMEARHGDLPATIMEEAVDAALAEHHIDILSDELKALAKADGKEAPYTRAELEAYIKAKFPTRKASEATFETFRRSAEKHGRDAEKALLAGKYDEAFKAKQRQVLSVVEAKEARAFARRAARGQRLLGRYGDNRVLKNVDQEYTDQVHNILQSKGLPSPRNPDELASALSKWGPVPFVNFLYNKAQMGRIIEVDDQLINSDVKFADFTVQQADNFFESMESLDHNGKEEKFYKVGADKIDHAIAVDRAKTEMAKNKDRYLPRRPGKIEKLKSGVYDWDAMLIKPEQLFDWLDNNDPLGVFNEVVFRGLSEGKHLENDLRKELGQKIKALPATKEFQASLNDRIENTELLDWQTGEPMDMTGQDLIGLMLNMGNPSNFGKLTSKFQYNGQDYQFDPLAVKGIVKQNATKEHWDFVQGVWDIFEHFWPRLEALARRVSGVAPDKIEALSIKTEWGTYKGGYYPLRADANWVGPRTGASGVFGADRYFRAIPPKSWEHARTGAAYPLDLNYSAIVPTMEQFVHDLAFREPLMNAVKFLEDTEIKQGMARAFGPEYLAQMKPWLEYVATSKRIDDPALSGVNRLARWSRERLVAVQLLYRASTIIKHTIAATFDSFGESGMYTNKAAYVKDFVANTTRLYGTPDGWRIISDIFDKSGEIRNRMHDMDRDIGDAIDRTLGQSGVRAVAMHYGGYGVSLLDLGSAIPTWYTHYKRALALDYEEADAIVIGDKAVRAAHGSAGPTDLAAIQRGNEVTRLFTVAYSFFSHSYNRVRAIGRESKLGLQDLRARRTADAFDKFSSAAWRSLWYIVLLGAAEEWIQPIPTKEGGHEGIASFLGKGMAYQLSGTLPFIRDFARAALYGRNDPAPTPLSSLYTTMTGAIADTYKQAMGRRVKQNTRREQIEAIGYALKLPGFGQLAASAQFLWDYKRHLQRAESPYRFGRGLLLGRSHPEEMRRR